MTSAESLQQQKASLRDKKRYVRLRLRSGGSLGTSCISEPNEAVAAMADDPELVGEDVWMTPAEFDALPDFGGW